jgi:hypothetical protein
MAIDCTQAIVALEALCDTADDPLLRAACVRAIKNLRATHTAPPTQPTREPDAVWTLRFTANNDGTITDNTTGLMWEQTTRGAMAWQEAVDSCAALDKAGHRDWRCPTISELLTIVDYVRSNPACDPLFKAQSDGYWSSTTHQFISNGAWYVYFNDGFTGINTKMNFNYVRAVRSGS